MRKSNFKSPAFWVSAVLFAAAFLFVLYYIAVPAKIEFHSDCTDTLMWAQASYDAGKVYNTDFKYAALLPFSTGLIMQLFIGITGISYTTHAIGMVGFLLLFSLSFVFMLKEAGFKKHECALSYFALIFIMSASKKLREIFWGHTIYYSLGLLFLFAGLALIFALIRRAKKRNFGVGFVIMAVLLALLCILSSLNGIQALTIFIFPAAGAVFGYMLLNFDEKIVSNKNVGLFVLGMAVLVCSGIGLLIGGQLAKGVEAAYENAFSKFVGSGEWSKNASELLRRWLMLAGVNIAADDDLMSVKSFFNIIRIFQNLLFVVIPVYRLITYEKIKHWQTKMFLLAHWVCSALILTGWIFGKISSANWRLTPILCTSVVFFMFYIKELTEEKRYIRLGVLFMLPVALYALSSLAGIVQLDTNFKKSENGKKITLLEENNCKYGYATFWNANAVTVLTGERICSRCVEIVDGTVEKRYYQSQKTWYKDRKEVDDYFLLLTEKEYKQLAEDNPDFIRDAVKVKKNWNYVLLIYDHNIF